MTVDMTACDAAEDCTPASVLTCATFTLGGGCSANEVCTAEGTECLGIASFDEGDVDG